MAEDSRLSKVHILIQQKRFPEAEQVLKILLAEDAYNVHYLALLAEANLQQDKFAAAEEIIDNAIGLSPDTPHLFYIKSRIAIQQDNYDQAERYIRHSITLDPYDADYFALLANLKLHRKAFQEALDLADQALDIDAENVLALNTRSRALLKLNRKEESFETIEGALREDPNNAFTHANYGWGLLEKGDHKKALEHFKEALQSNPNFEYAQSGLLEAIKASNPVYRMFLKYAFFMGNLTSRYQYFVIIGFYVLVRILRAIASENAALRPFMMPVIILLGLVAFSTWIIKPISNLFLRFNKYGRLLLSRQEKLSSNLVAASAAMAIIGIISYGVLQDERFLPIAIFGLVMMVPLGVMFSPAKNKYSLVIYTIAMAVVGLLAIGITFSNGELFNMMTGVFMVGFVVFQWVANYMLIKEG